MKRLFLFVLVFVFSIKVFAQTWGQMQRATKNAPRLAAMDNNHTLGNGQSEVIISWTGDLKKNKSYAGIPLAIIHYYAEPGNSQFAITGKLLGQIESGQTARFVVENGYHNIYFSPAIYNPRDGYWKISKSTGLANSGNLYNVKLELDGNIRSGVVGIFNLYSERVLITVTADRKLNSLTGYYPSLIQREKFSDNSSGNSSRW